MKRIVFVLTFSIQLLAFSTLYALDWGYATEDGGLPGAYLSWGAGARSLAMGKAYVGLSDDASAVYYNSAGLTQLKGRELTALYSVLWEKTNYSFVAYAQPVSRVKGEMLAGSWMLDAGSENNAESWMLKAKSEAETGDPPLNRWQAGGIRTTEDEIQRYYGTIGVALVNLSSSGFDKRDQYNEEQGKTGLSETAGIVSYAKKLTPELSGGINLKIANQHIDTYSDTGYGIDMGLLWKPRDAESWKLDAGREEEMKNEKLKIKNGSKLFNYLKPLTIGLSIQNLIAPNIKLKDQTDKFPLDIRLGLAYRLLNDRLTLAVDALKTENRSVKMHYGVEFSPYDIFSIRAGLDETEITTGFGVNVAGFSLDYAFSYHDAWKGHEDLGNSHRFGMTYKWGNIAESWMLEAKREMLNAEGWKLDVESESKGIQVYSCKGVKLETDEKIKEEKTKGEELKQKITEAIEKQTGDEVEDIQIQKIEEIAALDTEETKQIQPPTIISQFSTYTVVKGDCLWNIAKKPDIYHNPLEWTKIYEANQDKIKDADLIYPGQIFVIPRGILSEAR